MIDSKQFAERVKALMVPGPRGILDNVDDLVMLSRDLCLRLEQREGRIWIQPTGSDPGDAIELPWKRYFRIVLARLHVLCNERVPDSVGPYGGTGELTVPGDPPMATRVVFVNTTGEQCVELTPLRVSAAASPAAVPVSTDIRGSVRPVA
ncbi:MAG TPA: hypothetical protein VHR72_08150 [Gemmataceae bacterium]|nr:hypothetical protein [Gemmataceae bacterium]